MLCSYGTRLWGICHQNSMPGIHHILPKYDTDLKDFLLTVVFNDLGLRILDNKVNQSENLQIT
jgi:hypothetical protein